MSLRPRTQYACDEVVFHSNVKFFNANLNLKNVKAFQKDTHVISTPTKKKPKIIFKVDVIWKFQDVQYMKIAWANMCLLMMEIFQ
jgi:hypothetical protein